MSELSKCSYRLCLDVKRVSSNELFRGYLLSLIAFLLRNEFVFGVYNFYYISNFAKNIPNNCKKSIKFDFISYVKTESNLTSLIVVNGWYKLHVFLMNRYNT